MKVSRLAAAVAAGVGLVCAGTPTHAYTVYVSNEKGNSLTVIDSETLEVLETVPVGQRPRGITLTNDGSKLLFCAIRDDNPVLFFVHKRLYALEGEVNGTPGRLGEAAIVRDGRDITLVTAMKGVHDGLEAAAELEADGVSVEVVDLRTLRPFDLETVLASVRKTSRIVVVEEGPLTGGWAGEVLASVVEHGLGHLDDAWRIATPDTPIPYSPPLEDAFLPGAGRIAQEIRARVR